MKCARVFVSLCVCVCVCVLKCVRIDVVTQVNMHEVQSIGTILVSIRTNTHRIAGKTLTTRANNHTVDAKEHSTRVKMHCEGAKCTVKARNAL